MRQQGLSGWRGVRAGSCHAWALPADPTCAAAARQVFREAVSDVGLAPGLLDDCILMASELAANTLHARAGTRAGGGGDRLVSVVADMGGEPVTSASPTPHTREAPFTRKAFARDVAYAQYAETLKATAGRETLPFQPELWLYLRGLGTRRELVCKIFDGSRGWRRGVAPVLSQVSAHAVTGRGLQIVHELSDGRWGHHPTRARLGGWKLRGKAVWFAVPAPLAHARLADITGLRSYTRSADVTAARANQRLSARQAAGKLEAMLNEWGFTGRLDRADEPGADMSVLSFCRDLTVRCRSGVVSLATPEGSRQRWNYADLVEAAEQTVRLYEELELGVDLAEPGKAAGMWEATRP
jgi:hypothetical protein